MAGVPALHAQVGEVPQRVVESVRKIGRTDHQRQLDDLPFIVILAQLLERAAADGRRAAGDALRVEDGGFLFLVKVRAALIELQRRDLLVGNADSLRRSDVSACSILAPVHQRCLQIGQLLVARLDGAAADDGAVEGQKFLEHLGPVRHRGEKVRHPAEPFGHPLVGIVQLRWGLFLRQRIHYSHKYLLTRASLASHSNPTPAVYTTAGPAGTPPASFCMHRPGSG